MALNSLVSALSTLYICTLFIPYIKSELKGFKDLHKMLIRSQRMSSDHLQSFERED